MLTIRAGLVLVLTLLLRLWLTRTGGDRSLLALGSSTEAARASGLNADCMSALSLAASAGAAWAQDGAAVCYVTLADSHACVTPANAALEAGAAGQVIEPLKLSQEFGAQTGTDQLDTCIARGVDGIILWPLDPQACIPGLARAQAAGIPVLLVDSPRDAQAEPL